MNSRLRFWLISVVATLSIGLTMRLGFWQMDRAAQKMTLQASIDQQTQLPALNPALAYPLLAANAPSALHRHAVLLGTWLPQHTVFLDNRQMNGKPGFFVLTPFELTPLAPSVSAASAKKVILVQRGWVARNFLDRSQLPTLPPVPLGVVVIEGRIAPPPSKLFEFKGADVGPIRQNIDLLQFEQQTQLDLVRVSLLQADAEDKSAVLAAPNDGLLRHWAKPAYGVEKHYGYMFQWWALSALIAILYGWLQIIRPKFKRKNRH